MAFPQGLRGELGSLLSDVPAHKALGIELVAWLPGSATVQMTTTSDHANLAGTVHGGVLFALADAAFEVACNSHGRVAVALETTCHYSRPVSVGETITAGASEMSRSRRTGSYRIDVRDRKGDLIAWYMAMAYRTHTWHLGEDRWPEEWRATH
jgi:acyl-CoA thioesterase